MGPTEWGSGVSVLKILVKCLKGKTLKWNVLPTATNKVAKFRGVFKVGDLPLESVEVRWN